MKQSMLRRELMRKKGPMVVFAGKIWDDVIHACNFAVTLKFDL